MLLYDIEPDDFYIVLLQVVERNQINKVAREQKCSYEKAYFDFNVLNKDEFMSCSELTHLSLSLDFSGSKADPCTISDYLYGVSEEISERLKILAYTKEKE